MNPKFGVSSCLCVALIAVWAFPRPAEASSISLATAQAGGVTENDPVGGFPGGSGVIRSADAVSEIGYEAHAYSDVAFGLGFLTGGAKGLTNDENQTVYAVTTVDSSWGCPGGGCVTPSFGSFARINTRVTFDGVLDPLMFSPNEGGLDESSLEVFLRYTFPQGAITFRACYEAGDAFDRAESGCATFLEATLDRTDGSHEDLTGFLQFGVNGSGQPTVLFDHQFSWQVFTNNWVDNYELIIDMRSQGSSTPHVLNFYNTFGVQQTTTDPNVVFTTGSGLIAGPGVAAEVPEPASMLLVGTGVMAIALRLRRSLKRRT